MRGEQSELLLVCSRYDPANRFTPASRALARTNSHIISPLPGVRCVMNSRRISSHPGAAPKPATQEQIAALAHELWQERGAPAGSDVDIWLEAERQLNGAPPQRTERDPIPADPDRADADSDPAINPELDDELPSSNRLTGNRSPTSFGV